MNGELPGSEEVFAHFGVQGFPTMRPMSKDGKVGSKTYLENRDVETMFKFIKSPGMSGGAKKKKVVKKKAQKGGCVGKSCNGKCHGKHCKKVQKKECVGKSCNGKCGKHCKKAQKGGKKKGRGRGKRGKIAFIEPSESPKVLITSLAFV